MTKEEAERVLRDEIEAIYFSLAMPTSGNEEQDQAQLFSSARSTAMIAAGYCPNGCGELHEVGSYRTCLACGFAYRQSNISYD